METEDRLKAEHAVEPEREMHFCAMAPGNDDAANNRAIVDLIEIALELDLEEAPSEGPMSTIKCP